jgi:enoyl-CoA hydratase/carnithine racemase
MEGLEALIDRGGLGVIMLETIEGAWPALPLVADGIVRLGFHRRGVLPLRDLDWFDILLSIDPLASPPWVGLPADTADAAVARVHEMASLQPLAAAVLAQILRMSLTLTLPHALMLESLGYSTLLASSGFRQWREQTPRRIRPDESAGRVVLVEEEGTLRVRLSRLQSRNAFDAAMRDELVEALEFALHDPEQRSVVLDGEGPCFSAGGDLGEFGLSADAGVAHAVRVLQSPVRLVQALGARLTVRVHGACIGAGVEIAAAAACLVARHDTSFRLPEVAMGLIPGAGGTATMPRRIGRQRTCYLALTGADIDAHTARHWGLVDALE